MSFVSALQFLFLVFPVFPVFLVFLVLFSKRVSSVYVVKKEGKIISPVLTAVQTIWSPLFKKGCVVLAESGRGKDERDRYDTGIFEGGTRKSATESTFQLEMVIGIIFTMSPISPQDCM